MSKFEDLTGKTFGRLTVCKRAPNDAQGRVCWECVCSCGAHNTVIVQAGRLKRGETRSCGCIKKELLSKRMFKDLTGQKIGRLTVLRRIGKEYELPVKYECECSCPNHTKLVVLGASLLSGKTQSCGCYRKEQVSKLKKVWKTEDEHLLARRFDDMKKRCYNKNSHAYAEYGGRGIYICDEWLKDRHKFVEWGLTHGFRRDLSIDRIDNDGPYSPENCRWVDMQTQCNNRRSNHIVVVDGIRHNLTEWATTLHVDFSTVSYFLSKGQTAFEEFVRKKLNFSGGARMSDKSYDSSVIVSMDFLQHVREKSGMYSFQLNNIQGLHQQLKEVVDNSVDEALDPNKFYPVDITFFVSKDKSTYQCVIQDRGRGIPVDKLSSCYCTPFTSGKYRGEYGGSSPGSFGIGSKASAALSKQFVAFTKRNDGFGYLRVEKGVVKDSLTSKKRVDADETTIGTTVLLQPDDTMFTTINQMFKDNLPGEEFKGIDLYISRLGFYSLTKPNVGITVRRVDHLLTNKELSVDPVELWRYLSKPDLFDAEVLFRTDRDTTPRSFVIKKFGLHEPVWELGKIHKEAEDDDPLGVDLDIFLDDRSVKGEGGYIGAVNGTPIDHPESSHIAMLQTVMKDFIDDNVDDPDAKAFFEAKYRIPFSGVVFVSWLGASFIGQDKSKFEDRQFAECYRQYLRRYLKKYTDEHGEGIWDRLWELIQENFVTEYAKFSKRSLGISKNLKNVTYELRRKDSFSNCVSQDNRITEVVITEGDSAAGRVETCRDENTQAVYRLSGKPVNPIRSDKKKLDANAIYCDLQQILCVTPSDTNLDNMRFARIVIMTDADPDGYHIVVLLLAIIWRINKRIIEEGRVIIVLPPLYSIVDKRLGAVYLRDEAALRDARITVYKALLDIDMQVRTQKKNGKWVHVNNAHNIMMNKHHDAFRDLCMLVEEVGNTLVQQAELLNIPYQELEQLLHVIDCLDESNVNVPEIVKRLGLKDAIWMKEDNVLVLVDEMEIEHRIPLPRLQYTLKNVILPKYEIGHWQMVDLFVSTKYSDLYKGTPCTFAMLFRIFHDLNKLFEVRRFKGLGEMSAEAIKKTCIDPLERSYVTVKSVGDVEVVYQMLGVDTSARKKLVNSGYLEE